MKNYLTLITVMTDEYTEYIEKVVSELPGIIREELEYVNFKKFS